MTQPSNPKSNVATAHPTADGYSLDNKRTFIDRKEDILDILEKFGRMRRMKIGGKAHNIEYTKRLSA